MGITLTESAVNNQLYFHGGNLDQFDNEQTFSRNNRIVYGVGLYLTTSRTVADKYAKGSRKLYVVEVDNNIKTYDDVDIKKEVVKNTFTAFLSRPKHKQLVSYLERVNPLDVINAGNLNNILLNDGMISKKNIGQIADFFRFQGVDGEIDYSTFGYQEKQLVLINQKKVINVIRIAPNDPKYFDDFEYKK